MITGLPGTGIGGLFYILLGLWMPFREGMAGFRGRSHPARRRVVARQLLLAVSIIIGMGLIGELIGWLVAVWDMPLHGAAAEAATPGGSIKLEVENYLQPSLFAWAFLVLFAVVSGVHALRLAVRAVEYIRRVKMFAGMSLRARDTSSTPQESLRPITGDDEPPFAIREIHVG